MKLTTKGRYGLRFMMELAMRHGNGPVQVAEAAASQRISGKYVHNLVGNLKQAGLIVATRGPHGGCVLAREPAKITALEIVEALEGPLDPVACVGDEGSCDRSGACAARELWVRLAASMRRTLQASSLQQLAERQRACSGGGGHFEI